jgi:hypothetical protein
MKHIEAHNERKQEHYGNEDIVTELSGKNRIYMDSSKPKYDKDGFYTGHESYSEIFDRLIASSRISDHQLKGKTDGTAKVFDEMLIYVNTAYFEEHYQSQGYENARKFAIAYYDEAYKFAVKEIGNADYIISAIMHGDERHRRLSEDLGRDVFSYHMHISYIPIVEKEILWTKRVKDKSLVGTLKEHINQISHSKKWWTRKKLDENGDVVYKTDKHGNIKLNKDGKPKPELESAYSGLQDRIYEHMTKAGFPALSRGTRGSHKKHLHHMEHKAQEEAKRAEMYAEMAQANERAAVQMRGNADYEQSRASQAWEDADMGEERAKAMWAEVDQATDEYNEVTRMTDEAIAALVEIERLIEEKGVGLHEAERLNPQAAKIALEKIVVDHYEQERRNANTISVQQPKPPIRKRSQNLL